MKEIYLACGDFIYDYEGHSTNYFGAFASRAEAHKCIGDIVAKHGLAEFGEKYDSSWLINLRRMGRDAYLKICNMSGDKLILYVQEVPFLSPPK